MVSFWGLYLTLMLCYVYNVICVYIVRSTPLFCMHVCIDRRHVSAGSKVRRRTRRLVATIGSPGPSHIVNRTSEGEKLPQERDAVFPNRDPGRDIPVRVVSEQGLLDMRPFEVLE